MLPDSPSLVLERPSTRTEKGIRYEISTMPTFDVKKHALPLLKVAAASKTTRVLDHAVIDQGWRSQNFRPVIGDGADPTTIDEDGPCDLKKLPITGRVTLEVTKWSNGDTSTKCLRVER